MIKFKAIAMKPGPGFLNREILIEAEHINGEISRKLIPTKLNPLVYSLELITQLMNMGHELVKELLEYFIPEVPEPILEVSEVHIRSYEPEEVVEWLEDFPNGDPHFTINGISYSY